MNTMYPGRRVVKSKSAVALKDLSKKDIANYKLPVTSKSLKPLQKKSFYLDIKQLKHISLLTADIKALGGGLETFLSKDVSCVITDRPDAKYYEKNKSCVLSSNNSNLSPSVADTCSPSASVEERSRKVLSRGEVLLERAIAAKMNLKGNNDVLHNAHSWGVEVISLNKFMDWMLKYKMKHAAMEKKAFATPSSNSIAVLKQLFVKFEHVNRKYRPVFKSLTKWPELHLNTNSNGSPFSKKSTSRSNKHNDDESISNDEQDNEDEDISRDKVKSSKRVMNKENFKNSGYCEICSTHYSHLSKHLQSKQHQSFTCEANNYACLDQTIFDSGDLSMFVAKLAECQSPQVEAAVFSTPVKDMELKSCPSNPTPMATSNSDFMDDKFGRGCKKMRRIESSCEELLLPPCISPSKISKPEVASYNENTLPPPCLSPIRSTHCPSPVGSVMSALCLSPSGSSKMEPPKLELMPLADEPLDLSSPTTNPAVDAIVPACLESLGATDTIAVADQEMDRPALIESRPVDEMCENFRLSCLSKCENETVVGCSPNAETMPLNYSTKNLLDIGTTQGSSYPARYPAEDSSRPSFVDWKPLTSVMPNFFGNIHSGAPAFPCFSQSGSAFNMIFARPNVTNDLNMLQMNDDAFHQSVMQNSYVYNQNAMFCGDSNETGEESLQDVISGHLNQYGLLMNNN